MSKKSAGGFASLSAGTRGGPAAILGDMPTPGLCNRCRHQKLIRNTRGSTFSMCLRAREDPRYPKYPRIPVASCPGFERRPAGEDGG